MKSMPHAPAPEAASHQWRIAAASPADADSLAAIHVRCFATPWNALAFAALLTLPGALGLIARVTAQPIGTILLRNVADEAEILTLAVIPDWRAKGVGGALMSAGLDAARHSGATKIFLEVAQNNVSALALYHSFGFFCIGRREGYYQKDAPNSADDGTALILRCDL